MKPNFQKVTIAILKAYQYTDYDLAAELGIHHTTVHRLKNGVRKEPGYYLGVQIIKLYDERPKRARVRVSL